MGAIFRREISSYFTSPVGYIFLASFYACSGLFFSISSLESGSTELSSIFSMLLLACLVLIPILTMRTMSEEKKQKTEQCLLTSPLSLTSLVLGKFFAAFVIFSMGVLITLVYAIVVSAFNTPDWTVILGNIVGLELLGGAFIALGIFISSLTENQMVAAVASFVAMVALYLVNAIASIIPVQFISEIIITLSFSNRYNDFTMGIFNLSHVMFFVSVIVAFVFLTVRMLEKRRWS